MKSGISTKKEYLAVDTELGAKSDFVLAAAAGFWSRTWNSRTTGSLAFLAGVSLTLASLDPRGDDAGEGSRSSSPAPSAPETVDLLSPPRAGEPCADDTADRASLLRAAADILKYCCCGCCD